MSTEKRKQIVRKKLLLRATMEKLACELEFISQIKRDGSGVTKVKKSYLKAMHENKLMKDQPFILKRLSMNEETFIAFNFNAFVVKLKQKDK